MSAQARVVPEHFYYWGGMADKVEGRVIPLHGQTRSTTRCASRSEWWA